MTIKSGQDDPWASCNAGPAAIPVRETTCLCFAPPWKINPKGITVKPPLSGHPRLPAIDPLMEILAGQ